MIEAVSNTERKRLFMLPRADDPNLIFQIVTDVKVWCIVKIELRRAALPSDVPWSDADHYYAVKYFNRDGNGGGSGGVATLSEAVARVEKATGRTLSQQPSLF